MRGPPAGPGPDSLRRGTELAPGPARSQARGRRGGTVQCQLHASTPGLKGELAGGGPRAVTSVLPACQDSECQGESGVIRRPALRPGPTETPAASDCAVRRILSLNLSRA